MFTRSWSSLFLTYILDDVEFTLDQQLNAVVSQRGNDEDSYDAKLVWGAETDLKDKARQENF